MSYLMKLFYSSLATLTVGGGAYAGIVSSSSNTPSNKTALTSDSKRETLQQRPENVVSPNKSQDHRDSTSLNQQREHVPTQDREHKDPAPVTHQGEESSRAKETELRTHDPAETQKADHQVSNDLSQRQESVGPSIQDPQVRENQEAGPEGSKGPAQLEETGSSSDQIPQLQPAFPEEPRAQLDRADDSNPEGQEEAQIQEQHVEGPRAEKAESELQAEEDQVDGLKLERPEEKQEPEAREEVMLADQSQHPKVAPEGSSLPEHREERTEQPLTQSSGNCEVIKMPEEVEKQLPTGISYVAFSCKNNNGQTELVDWKGYFPVELLVKGPEFFKEGTRINIDVSDAETLINGDNYEEQLQDEYGDEEGEYQEPYWTLFDSDQFRNKTIVGNWGDTTAQSDTDDGEEVEDDESDSEERDVYRVKLQEPAGSSNLYLEF